MPLTIKPILPGFGAEVSGADLTKPLSEALRHEILDVQHEWGVTVWRNTGLDDESHIAFSRMFGHLELAPRPRPSRHRHREIFDASNLDAEGAIIDTEATRLIKKGDRIWHTDSSYMEKRSAYSLLLAHEVPPDGGQTWFADTRTAYEDLPQSMKDRLEGLVGENSYWWSRKQAGFAITEEEIDARPSARHPLVHVHQGSRRKALYIAAHTRDIVGMPREEGRKLLAELTAHATQPKYVFAVTWGVGDLTIWDNLCTMHRGGDFDVARDRRDMRRTTVREGAPPSEPDDPFADLYAAGAAPLSQPAPARPS
ncbi:MAG: TauD/TfdA family dioxygenase [Hyphomonadaceae bacterium]|nr:TauD/TfdA family dioxygenase [Hyphomonadaceae bacterium]